MNSNEFNKVLHPYISNEIGLTINDNSKSSENLTISTTSSFSLLYSRNRKCDSLVRKSSNKKMAKRTTVFYAKNDNPILLVNTIRVKSNNSYANQVMISNGALYSGRNIFNNAMNNTVTVSNNSEVVMFATSEHGRIIIFPNEGVSNANELLDNTIIRREKEDKTKVYHVLETSIVTDTTKALHSVDSVSIKGSKIPGTYMFTTTDSTTKNSTI